MTDLEKLELWLKAHNAEAGCVWHSDTTQKFNAQTSNEAGIFFVEADSLMEAIANWDERFEGRRK